MKMNAFSKIADWLNEEGIIWALGASSVLYYNGYETVPNDFDLFVSLDQYQKVESKLNMIGKSIYKEDTNSIYNTQGFNCFEIEDIEVDLIAGFYIRHDEGEFKFPFDWHSIDQVFDYEGSQINVMSLEDWYVLYQLIPGREEKVKVIYDFLMNKEFIRMGLLKRTLELELPEEIKQSIMKITQSQ